MSAVPEGLEDSFCILPWVHVQFGEQGKIKACCISSTTYGNLNQSTFEEIWVGDAIKQFRAKMLRGQKDKRCSICYKQEAQGKSSMRIWANKRFKHVNPMVFKVGQQLPRYWDIRFSNSCNLKCRTCWHGASSSWFEEGKRLQRTASNKAIVPYIPDTINFTKEFLHWTDNTEEIYFAGGEPLFTPQHYELLETLIQQGKTQLHLRYNSNLTKLHFKDYSLKELWTNFKKVSVAVSLDHIEDKGEFIRKGMSWPTIKNNIYELREFGVQLSWHPTVSVFNVLDLCDIHKYLASKKLFKLDELELNLLHRPSFYNIANLNNLGRSMVINNINQHLAWLNEQVASQYTISQFEEIRNYLQNAPSSNLKDAFVQETETLDSFRNEDFKRIFPELLPLIN